MKFAKHACFVDLSKDTSPEGPGSFPEAWPEVPSVIMPWSRVPCNRHILGPIWDVFVRNQIISTFPSGCAHRCPVPGLLSHRRWPTGRPSYGHSRIRCSISVVLARFWATRPSRPDSARKSMPKDCIGVPNYPQGLTDNAD